jgi:hypothetical protein
VAPQPIAQDGSLTIVLVVIVLVITVIVITSNIIVTSIPLLLAHPAPHLPTTDRLFLYY